MPQTTDWADVQVVGIPRALLFYRFGVLWTTFFESIGRTVVVSDPTDKAIADEGDRLSVDECCLASKVLRTISVADWNFVQNPLRWSLVG